MHEDHTKRAIGQLLQQLERAGAVIAAAERPRPMTHERARDFVRHEIANIITSTSLKNPDATLEKILELCTPALTDVLLRMARF